MPPALFWLVFAAYLIVAAATLLQAEIRLEAGARPSPILCAAAALGFAACWPVRVLVSILRR